MRKTKELIREISTISDLGKPTNKGFSKKKCEICGDDLDKNSNCLKYNGEYKN